MPFKTGSEHYKAGKLEPLDLIEAQDLDFHMGSVVKYAVRAFFYRKIMPNHAKVTENLTKAIWYCNRYMELHGLTKDANIPGKTE